MSDVDVFQMRSRDLLRKLSDVNQRAAVRLCQLAEIAPDVQRVLLAEADDLRSAADRLWQVAIQDA